MTTIKRMNPDFKSSAETSEPAMAVNPKRLRCSNTSLISLIWAQLQDKASISKQTGFSELACNSQRWELPHDTTLSRYVAHHSTLLCRIESGYQNSSLLIWSTTIAFVPHQVFSLKDWRWRPMWLNGLQLFHRRWVLKKWTVSSFYGSLIWMQRQNINKNTSRFFVWANLK